MSNLKLFQVYVLLSISSISFAQVDTISTSYLDSCKRQVKDYSITYSFDSTFAYQVGYFAKTNKKCYEHYYINGKKMVRL